MGKYRMLNKKELKELQIQLVKWSETIDERIHNWMETLDADLRKSLDKTPDSFLALERYLIDNFEDGSARDKKNEKVFDAVCTYIGEVFRINLPGNLVWLPNPQILESDPPVFNFQAVIGFARDNNGIDPFSNIPYTIHKKHGRELYEYFGKKNISILKKIESRNTPVDQEPGLGGHNYQYFFLISDDSINLPSLEIKLKQYYKNKSEVAGVYVFNEATLIVEFRDKYCFHLWYDDRSLVAVESAEIASVYSGTKKSNTAIAACSKRFDFWGDEDPKGKYFNEHLFLLSEIVKISGVYIYDFKQGVFYDEME